MTEMTTEVEFLELPETPTPEELLEAMKTRTKADIIDNMMIIGTYKDGSTFCFSTSINLATANWLIDQEKQRILNGD